MFKKLHISLIISNLVVLKLLSAIVWYMHNFIVKFAKILEIVKEFAGNRVTKHDTLSNSMTSMSSGRRLPIQ